MYNVNYQKLPIYETISVLLHFPIFQRFFQGNKKYTPSNRVVTPTGENMTERQTANEIKYLIICWESKETCDLWPRARTPVPPPTGRKNIGPKVSLQPGEDEKLWFVVETFSGSRCGF